MVFYFSGTGNTRWVAETLAEALNQSIYSIADIMKRGETRYSFEPDADEPVLFVFPVHSWGPAELMNRFVKNMNLKGVSRAWAVVTCGDECGMTDQLFAEQLRKKHITLAGCFSVTMPNNYILMRGFGVDSEEVIHQKLLAAPDRVAEIVKAIQEEKASSSLYLAGSMKWIKSKVVYPLFRSFAIGSSSFFQTDKCNGCGKCARLCPTGNITMIHKQPEWGKDCIQCTACIHRCSQHAIEYGRVTQKMGRYYHPSLGRHRI